MVFCALWMCFVDVLCGNDLRNTITEDLVVLLFGVGIDKGSCVFTTQHSTSFPYPFYHNTHTNIPPHTQSQPPLPITKPRNHKT